MEPVTALAEELRSRLEGDVIGEPAALDAYARDASPYLCRPALAIRPMHRDDCLELVRWAAANSVPLIPRAGGTSLAGQCVGDGVVVDTGYYMNHLRTLELDGRRTTVEAGVVRDTLNTVLAPFSLSFAPDPSSTARCQIGGMIGNNAWGLHGVSSGTTREHIEDIEVILSDGSAIRAQPLDAAGLAKKLKREDREGECYRAAVAVVDREIEAIRAGYPGFRGIISNAGYALDALARMQPWNADGAPFNLSALFCGAEGTLGLVTEATLKLTPLPAHRRLVRAQFARPVQALEVVPDIVGTVPAAVEWLDQDILELGRLDIRLGRQCRWLGDPARSLLVIEYAGEDDGEVERAAAELARRLAGTTCTPPAVVADDAEIDTVWALRRAALSLLMEMPGGLRAVTGIEDTAVHVGDLPRYYEEIMALLDARGLKAYAYGPVGMGAMHLRPVFPDLAKGGDGIDAYTAMIEDVAAVTARYRGSFSAKHGVGRMRGDFLATTVGERLMPALAEIKRAFDPAGIFNPGKILDCPPMVANLKPFADP
jgi:FAD/FMN-containing dehydrogenase